MWQDNRHNLDISPIFIIFEDFDRESPMPVPHTRRSAPNASPTITSRLTAALGAAASKLPIEQQERLVARKTELPKMIAQIAAKMEKSPARRDEVSEGEGEGLGDLLTLQEGRDRLHIYATPTALEDWAGPVAGPSELERDYGIARSTLHAWQNQGAVIGLLKGVRKHVFPTAQFVDGRPVEGLTRVVAAAPAARAAWLWLITPHGALRGDTPLDHLRSGRLAEIGELAESDYGLS
jgi:hypothetical protein